MKNENIEIYFKKEILNEYTTEYHGDTIAFSIKGKITLHMGHQFHVYREQNHIYNMDELRSDIKETVENSLNTNLYDFCKTKGLSFLQFEEKAEILQFYTGYELSKIILSRFGLEMNGFYVEFKLKEESRLRLKKYHEENLLKSFHVPNSRYELFTQFLFKHFEQLSMSKSRWNENVFEFRIQDRDGTYEGMVDLISTVNFEVKFRPEEKDSKLNIVEFSVLLD